MTRHLPVVAAFLLATGALWHANAQQPGGANQPDDVQVRAIEPPAQPLPREQDTSRITQFSFFAYGDTRSAGATRPGDAPADGHIVQVAHSEIVTTMIAKAQQLASTSFPVRFVVASGDAVLYGPNGTMWNASYVPVVERLTKGAGLPFFFAPGNHDLTVRPLGDAERQHGIRNVESAMANLIPPEGSPRRLPGYVTYAFGYGNAFFIMLDSNVAGDPTQLAWVTGQLDGLDRQRYRHVFAVFHHPPFDSGQYGGPMPQAQSLAIRSLYLPLFRKHHVRMTICGHDHLLDHYVERYEDHGRTYRMDHLVSAGGGAPTYVYKGEPNLDEYAAANSAEHVSVQHLITPGMTAADNPHHFVVVRVDGDHVSLEVVASGNAAYRPYGRDRLELN